MSCIFGSKNQWASVERVAKKKFERIASLEQEFGKTIHRTKTVTELADKGKPYEAISSVLIRKALSSTYTTPITTTNWTLPAGAYAESTGPT
jgi:hypothetical protein